MVSGGAVEQRHGMCSLGDVGRDLLDVQLHGSAVGEGRREAGASGRADRPKQIGAPMALVSRLARPGPAPCPLADDPVRLADPGFIARLRGAALEPDLDLPLERHALEMSRERAHLAILLRMARRRAA